jgi:hypothetical protein
MCGRSPSRRSLKPSAAAKAPAQTASVPLVKTEDAPVESLPFVEMKDTPVEPVDDMARYFFSFLFSILIFSRLHCL